MPPLIYLSTAAYIGLFALTLQSNAQRNRDVKDQGGSKAPEVDNKQSATLSVGSRAYKPDGRKQGVVYRTENNPQIAKTILLGTPSPASLIWSFITVAVNILLMLGVVDMVYRGPLLYQSNDLSFARVGYVSDSTANLLLREPDTSQLPIFISYRGLSDEKESNLDDAWKSAGQVYWLSNDTDFTYTITLRGLQPLSRYQYTVSNNHTGIFTTAPPVGQINHETKKFSFLASSCLKANFPYSPFSHPLSIPGFQHLAKLIPSLHASFMLFLGDFIYIDVPHRFGSDSESYRRQYRQIYASPDWPGVSNSLPWIHVLDDHDIANDWDANTTAPYPAAIDPFNLYHASVNPPPAHPSASYFSFTQGPAAFFLLDTRRYRSPSSLAPDSPEKSMLGPTQLSSLLSFLSHRDPPGVKWKFVVSSVPFTRNWRINSADTWAGYLHERQIVLSAMWNVGARGDGVGVVVLSGDRHEFGATAFPPPKDGKWPISATMHEFSTSPLNMFYLPTRTYREVEGQDEICIKYVPDGNSKFGAIEIEEVEGGEQSLLRFKLFVDGALAWEYVLMTPPSGERRGRERDAVWG